MASSKDKKWTVYVHMNKTNGKVYVGITSKNPPERRWQGEGSGYSTQMFYNYYWSQ